MAKIVNTSGRGVCYVMQTNGYFTVFSEHGEVIASYSTMAQAEELLAALQPMKAEETEPGAPISDDMHRIFEIEEAHTFTNETAPEPPTLDELRKLVDMARPLSTAMTTIAKACAEYAGTPSQKISPRVVVRSVVRGYEVLADGEYMATCEALSEATALAKYYNDLIDRTEVTAPEPEPYTMEELRKLGEMSDTEAQAWLPQRMGLAPKPEPEPDPKPTKPKLPFLRKMGGFKFEDDE